MNKRLIAALIAAPALLGTTGCATTAARSVATPAPVLSQEERRLTEDLERFVNDALTRFPTVPALGVAVSRGGGPIFIRSYGMADRERQLRAGPDTLFYIASSTKSFVALAFARLEQQGRIDLDWTLAELAPGVAFAPEVRAREVTLRHLLSHSHGLAHPGIEFRLAYTGEHDPATLWRLLAGLRPHPRAALGTFNYGNLGYNVAALLVERRLRRRWQDIVREQVFRPLGLDRTIAEGIARPDLPLAAPYDGERRLAVAKTDATLQSAGGIYADMDDLARWVSVQLRGSSGATGGPMPAQLVASTHAPFVTMEASFGPFSRRGYGLGWYSGPYRGQMLYHSFGSFVGARAHTSFMPSRDIGVAAMSNDEEAGFQLVDVIAAYVYDWLIDGPDAAAQRGRETLDNLERQLSRHRESRAADRARRAARSWRLSLPPSAYRGRYCNTDRGTIEIAGAGAELEVRMGLLRTVAEPFTEPDSARIELVPNSGEVAQFSVGEGRATGLRIGGSTFERCG